MSEWTTKREKIVGFVGPQKRSDGRDLLVHLYPELKNREVGKFVACTVYEERFGELPDDVTRYLTEDNVLGGSAPTSQKAKQDGWWRECEPFVVEVYLDEDGKDTKKLAHVLGSASEVTAYGPTTSPYANGIAAAQASGQRLEFQELPDTEIADLASKIANESAIKMAVVIEEVKEVIDSPDSLAWSDVLGHIWRDVTIQYRDVRPALLRPATASAQPDASVVRDGARVDFLSAVSGQHPNIADEDEAKAILQFIGVNVSAEDGDGRLVQAKRAWLYATLISEPYLLNEDLAATVAGDAFPDEVPF